MDTLLHTAYCLSKRVLLVVSLAVLCAQVTHAANASENKIKTALIYKLTKFVTWPDRAFNHQDLADFRICAFNENVLDGNLSALIDKSVHGRKIKLKYINPEDTSPACHVLFVDQAHTDSHVRIANTPILTIGDSPSFAETSGIIEIYRKKNKFKLKINIQHAKASDLKIAAPLLQLSTIVQTKGVTQ